MTRSVAGVIIKLRSAILMFGRNEEAATAIEYGLIIAGISIAIVAAIFAIGDELTNLFNAVQTKIASNYS